MTAFNIILAYSMFGAIAGVGYYGLTCVDKGDEYPDTKKEVLLILAASVFWPITFGISCVKGLVLIANWWIKLKDE